ncbi:LolA family protein [Ponticaulis profundi]|uniref:Outer membrane lipoprotein carrier protein LolA n=1 Tax=Ponticaulis profundi TaxID=2665222 RepID=A0ABW1SCN8_9PROT
MFNLTEWIISGAMLFAPAATTAAQSKTVEPAPTVLAQAATEPQEPPAVVSTLNVTEAIANANKGLSKIETAQGRFTQIDQAGRFSQGDFYLSRPGRMRFEYDDPVPLLIVSDGTTVAIEDSDLETVDRVPLASTPLNMLLRSETDLAAHANILDVSKKGGLVAIRMSDKSGDAEGELELFFDPATYELRQWESIDMNGAVTTVQLIDTETGVRLLPSLFRVEDPEDEDDRR